MSNKLTPIQEYFANQQKVSNPQQISNNEIYSLLKQIQFKQYEQRPQFAREVGANLVGSGIFWVIENGLKRILK